MAINLSRFVVGSIVGAVVLFVASGIVNGAILGADWQNWLKAQGPLNSAPSQSAGMLLWAITSLVYGAVGMWIYVSFRQSYGPGPYAAVLSGLALWLAGGLTSALAHFALGDISPKMAIINCLAYLICDPIALVAAGWFYKE